MPNFYPWPLAESVTEAVAVTESVWGSCMLWGFCDVL